MKITGDPLHYCRAVPKTVRAVVLYGPNRMLIGEAIAVLQKNFFAGMEKNDFSIVTITPEQLKQNPTALADEVASFGFFAAQKFIHLKNGDDVFVKPLQDALSLPQAGHFIVIEAGELTPKSVLRAWAEKAPDIACMACYMMEGAALQRFVQAQFQQQGARVSNDAALMIMDRMGNDLSALATLIPQLMDYAGTAQPQINLEHVEALLVDQSEQALESVTQAVADKNAAALDRALHNLDAGGTSMIAVLRVLQNYFYRLRSVQAALKNGEALDGALMKLRPPVFFKMKAAFSRHLRAWPLPAIDTALQEFVQLEAACKKTGTPELSLVQFRLLRLCLKKSA